MTKLTVRTQIQKNLFDIELSGQISDGMWENTRPFEHWKVWCDCKVEVGTELGRDFYAVKDNYAFNSSELLDVVGDRMLRICQLTIAGLSQEEVELCYDYDHVTLKKYASNGDKYWVEKLNKFESIGVERIAQALLIPYDIKMMKKEINDLKKIIKIKK
jgi:hypothetical protein